jgi:hypothetical protein
MNLVELGDSLSVSASNMWAGVINFTPKLIVAILIALIGVVIGAILGKLVAQLIKLTKVDNALKAAGADKFVEKSGIRLDVGAFIGALVKWFFIVVFLVVSFDILGLQAVTAFLTGDVLSFLPKVIVAAIIIVVAAIIAEAMQKVVVASAKAAASKSANFAGNIAKGAVWLLAIFAVVAQFDSLAQIVGPLLQGIIIAVSLAVGLAFGLGGQDAAAKYIEKLKNDIAHK